MPCALLASPVVGGPWLAVLVAGLLSWALPPLPPDLSRDHIIARRIGAAAVGLTLASCGGSLLGWTAGEPVTLDSWTVCHVAAGASWLAARTVVYLEDLDQ